MAPKKPTVTRSSTRSARVKGGSNPVVTKGEARTRAARTSLGPAPKQRPLATGGTKGPLQGGTRSPGLKMDPSKLEAGPAKVGPNLGQQSTSSSAGPRSSRGPSVSSLEAKAGRVGPNLKQQSTLSSAGPRSVRPAATKSSGITMSGDRNAAIKGAGNPAGPRAPKPAFGPVPTATEARNARNAANRTAKGYGVPSKVETGLRQAYGVAKGVASLASGPRSVGLAAIVDTLKPRSLANEPNANITRFANARNMAFAKAKGIKGSPVLGGKKSIAASFDSAFAAARKAGKSGFTFKGKKYTTKMK